MFAGFWGVRKNIFSSVNFELALIIGSGSLIAGISLILWSVYQWSLVGFGETDVNLISRFVFNGATFFAIGIQLFGAIFANAAINYSLSDEPVDKPNVENSLLKQIVLICLVQLAVLSVFGQKFFFDSYDPIEMR